MKFIVYPWSGHSSLPNLLHKVIMDKVGESRTIYAALEIRQNKDAVDRDIQLRISFVCSSACLLDDTTNLFVLVLSRGNCEETTKLNPSLYRINKAHQKPRRLVQVLCTELQLRRITYIGISVNSCGLICFAGTYWLNGSPIVAPPTSQTPKIKQEGDRIMVREQIFLTVAKCSLRA